MFQTLANRQDLVRPQLRLRRDLVWPYAICFLVATILIPKVMSHYCVAFNAKDMFNVRLSFSHDSLARFMNPINPYQSPKSPPEAINNHNDLVFVRGSKTGPALYITLAALAVPIMFATTARRIFSNFEPAGFTTPMIGCVVGALIYRFRSRAWPVDPSAKNRILKFSAIAILTPPAIMVAITRGGRGQGFGMVIICLIVGVSVAVGIVVSGTRRDGELLPVTHTEHVD